jgi:O-antigen ligase
VWQHRGSPLVAVTPRSLTFPVAVALVALPWLNPFSPGPSPAVVPWLATFACAVLLWLLALRSGARPPLRVTIVAALVVLAAWLPHPDTSEQVAILAAALALVLLGVAVVQDRELGAALERGILLAAAVSALIGMGQYFGLVGSLAPWVNAADAGLAFGNLRQPNQFTTLCWLGMAVLLWGSARVPRGVAFGLAVLLAMASAASVSRTAMLQGLVLTLLALAWPGPQRRTRVLLCVAAAIAYFAALFLLPVLLAATGVEPPRTLAARLAGVQECSSRLVLWSNVLRITAQKPLLGWGWGELDYAHFMTLYPGARFCDILDNAHNLPLHLAAELGVPVALALTGGFVWWAWRQRPQQERDARRQLAWAILALVLLHSLLEYPLWYGPFQLVAGAALGWLLRAAPPAQAPAARLSGTATALALLCATAYAGWDYARVSQMYLLPQQRFAPWREETMEHAQRSWLFARQAWFAGLTVSSLDRGNARDVHALAQEVLHYSPEPRVIERLIESETMLGRYDEAVLDLARYRAAFPQDYQAWRTGVRAPRAP